MAYHDSTRYPHLQEILGCYWLPGGVDEPLEDIIERVKADAPADVPLIRGDISTFMRSSNTDLDEAFDAEFVSYYWPGGDGLTAREWLSRVDALLAKPPDTSRDHRSGMF